MVGSFFTSKGQWVVPTQLELSIYEILYFWAPIRIRMARVNLFCECFLCDLQLSARI